MTQMLNGEEIPGYKVVEGRGSREWSDEDSVIARLQLEGYGMADITKTELLSPYQMEKAIGKKKVAEFLSERIVTKPGNPTIAPATDKREAYNQKEASRKAFE